jgi:predicted O-linked N-acetylglucosamine transferase (SPINDLY family)
MNDPLRPLLQQGLAFHREGKLDEAKSIYEKILTSNPRYTDALHFLGLIAHSTANYTLAEELIRKAINTNEVFFFYNSLGNALREQGKKDEAIVSYERALALKPEFPDALNNLGAVYLSKRDRDKAEELYKRALSADPNHADTLVNMGNLNQAEGHLDDAIKFYQRAITVRPNFDALISLGNIYGLKNLPYEALAYYQEAFKLQPDSPAALSNMGAVFSKLDRYDDAVAFLEKAISIDPHFFHAFDNLGGVYKNLGSLDKAIEYYKKGLAVSGCDAGIYSNLLLTMVYADSVSPEELANTARQYGEKVADPLIRKRPFLNNKDSSRKLRIGYVSPDFRNHPVSYFFEPLLKLHNREKFEVYAYANLRDTDEVTDRLQKEFDHWRDIGFLNDNKVADMIEADKIDILIDLAGHTGYNRLKVFALKPAPVQVSWLGYPATTGMNAIDYRITDAYAEPEGMTEHLNTEKLWRLPDIFCCYQPHENSPAVIDHPPFEDNGYITFGCFNNFSKVTDDVLKTWSKIMEQVPESRLLLEIAGIDRPVFRAEAEERLRKAEIPIERVTLERRSRVNQFVLYNKIDIALDPFPCNGGTTSMDTLWMGVPLVTLAGKHFVSRMGVTILTNAGLPELIAKDTDEYVEIAVNLAKDHAHLKKLRHGLRDKFADSPAMNQQIFAENMEAAYRKMWEKWCAEGQATTNPDLIEKLTTRAVTFKDIARIDEAVGMLKRVLELDPNRIESYDYMLLLMVASSVSPEKQAEAAFEFGERFTNHLRRERPFLNNVDPDRKLRIGYVSPNFCRHPVNYFFEPLLNLHNSDQFEIFTYSNTPKEDAVTERLKKSDAHWRDITKLSNDEATDLIEQDTVDILIDLAGHTMHNRLLVFARKPAPVQITWLGHPATTGMKAIDYRITDIYAEPPGMTEHLNIEKLWRLPEIFCCYQPHENSPAAIDHPPFEDNGYITFGCFNNFSKVKEDVLKVWAQIMQRVPDARLLLEIQYINHPDLHADVLDRLNRCNFPMDRVIIELAKVSNQYVLYNKIDIALDPFPCNGGTTSFDTLWMGVPFVALEGKHFVSRMGVSILTNGGLPELIAHSTGEYIDIVVNLANNRDRLKKMRHNLRDRIAKSPLMNQERFTRNMEAAYREMWRKWCAEK